MRRPVWANRRPVRSANVAGLAAVLLVVPAGGCAGAPAPAPPPAGPPAAVMRVGLVEWAFTLSAPALRAGGVRLEVTNAGSTAHDLRVLDGSRVLAATPPIPPGASDVVEFDATGLQQVEFFCTLPGHADHGMVRTVAVAAAPDPALPTKEGHR
jgi:hypothetical protein